MRCASIVFSDVSVTADFGCCLALRSCSFIVMITGFSMGFLVLLISVSESMSARVSCSSVSRFFVVVYFPCSNTPRCSSWRMV